MPIARITGQGLAAIAFSVAILWACFIGERLMVHQALAQRTQLMRELRQMQRHNHNTTQPVSIPPHVRTCPSHPRLTRPMSLARAAPRLRRPANPIRPQSPRSPPQSEPRP